MWDKFFELDPAKSFFWMRFNKNAVLSQSLTQVDTIEFLDKLWLPKNRSSTPWKSGYFGMIPYENWKKPNHFKKISIYRAENLEFFPNISSPKTKAQSWPYKPLNNEAQFLEGARNAIQDIKDGRFYQINLLRYFELIKSPSFQECIQNLGTLGGPWSSWVHTQDLEILSFSPEQFIQILPKDQETFSLKTFPIKGTRPRHHDHKQDQQAIQELLNSEKEKAELHMIIDLMRNDLNQISRPNTVKVNKTRELHSFHGVHHTIGEVESEIDAFRFKDLIQSLCPGGSITGTPKLEVMKAIKEYEKRDRGPFMGHMFYWDDSYQLHSNVLIRTLAHHQDKWNFATGSGITMQSDPEEELREIQAKCRSFLSHN